MQKQRLLWLDIAKGIAILLIIMGHTVTGTTQRLIYSFHVPLFLVLAGYTFSLKEETFLASLKKDFKRLIVPVLVVCILRLLIDTLLNPAGFSYYLKSTGLKLLWANACDFSSFPGIGKTWFLIDLFFAKQLYRVIRKYITQYRPVFICMLAFIGIFIGERAWLPYSMDLVLVSLLFLEVGSILRDLDHLYPPPQKILPLVGCVSFFIWLYLAYTRCFYIEMSVRQYSQAAQCILTVVTGCIFMIQFSRSIEPLSLISLPFIFLGQHSLLLLCIHELDSYLSHIWDLSFLKYFPIFNIPTVLTSSPYVFFTIRMAIDVAILFLILVFTRFIRKPITYIYRFLFHTNIL